MKGTQDEERAADDPVWILGWTTHRDSSGRAYRAAIVDSNLLSFTGAAPTQTSPLAHDATVIGTDEDGHPIINPQLLMGP